MVVNGIVENYVRAASERLADGGAVFSSETDAEVIAHLIAEHYSGDLAEAVRAAYARARGPLRVRRDEPRRARACWSARASECPLVVGRGEGEQFIASAVPAFLAETRRVQYVENGEIVVLRPDGVEITTADGVPVERASSDGRLG